MPDVLHERSRMAYYGSYHEQTALAAAERALASISFDEIRGIVCVANDGTSNEESEFSSLEQLEDHLQKVYDDQWYADVGYSTHPRFYGRPIFDSDPLAAYNLLLKDTEIESFFDRHAKRGGPEIYTVDQLLLPYSDTSPFLRVSLEDINEELIAYLAAHPEKMRELSPRKFEELVADLFRNQGFEVMLTPRSRDGGMDVIAVQRSGIGTVMIIVECKRYAATNKVGVEIVRGLYGVVEQHRATQGIVATTSYFTRGAQEFRDSVPFRLGFADFRQLSQQMNAWHDENMQNKAMHAEPPRQRFFDGWFNSAAR